MHGVNRIKELNAVGFVPVKEAGTKFIQYDNKETGQSLLLSKEVGSNKNFTWSLVDKSGAVAKSGDGFTPLMEHLTDKALYPEKHEPVAASVPSGGAHVKPAQSAPISVPLEAKIKSGPTDGGSGIDKYTTTSNDTIYIIFINMHERANLCISTARLIAPIAPIRITRLL